MVERSLIAAMLAGILVAGLSQPALAQDGFYRGKTVTIVVGYSAGGGYDQYARLVARHLGRHIPGQPSVIVQNMPGAASMTSVRHLDANAAKDGTVITTFDPCLVLETIAAPETYKVKFSDFRWVGTLLRDIRICYASTVSGIKSWQEMMARKEFLIGNTARGSNAYVNGAILRKVFRAPVRQISGYPGSNEQRLALERGELEGNCGSWTAIPQDWIVNHKINALLLLAQASRRHAGERALRQRSRFDAGAEGSARRAQWLRRARPTVHRGQAGSRRAGFAPSRRVRSHGEG